MGLVVGLEEGEDVLRLIFATREVRVALDRPYEVGTAARMRSLATGES